MVSTAVSSRDQMLNLAWPDAYFEIGKDGLRCIRHALEVAGVQPERILDLPCGHGRVLRWLVKEFHEAEISACDLDGDAVDFCAERFGVKPLHSHRDPRQIPLAGKYDLIWVGSLFTHLDAMLWTPLLEVLAEHLAGVLVFTVGGRYFIPDDAWLQRQLGRNASILTEKYEDIGFGYADYPRQDGYGLARAKPSWVLSLLDSLPLKVVHLGEGEWTGYQDIYACVRD